MKLNLFLFSFFISSTVFSQIDVPVDPLTGRARVTLPIWSVSNNTVSSSVALVYDGGGVRAAESEGNAGMSWNVLAGGMVQRMVKGLPDDLNVSGDTRKGWLHGGGTQANNFTPTADEGCTDWTNFSAFTTYNVDTEPDLFYFNAPGLSGKFVFDNSGVVRLLPFQDVKITCNKNANNEITSIEILNNVGVKYVFSLGQKMTREAIPYHSPVNHFVSGYNYYSKSLSFYYQWGLTSVTGPYGESITYDFNPSVTSMSKNYIRKINTAMTGVDSIYFYQDIAEYRSLQKINSPGHSVTFNWSNQGQLISSIVVSNTNTTTVKTFVFNYESIRNASEPTGLKGEHSRNYLTSISEESNCEILPSYSFEYYSPASIPYAKKYPVDLFGYYNAATVTSVGTVFIPPVYTNANALQGYKFRFYSMSGYTAVSSSTTRDVNPSTVHFGSLKKMIYPSGGFTEFTYQPNEFYDVSTTSSKYAAGVRVSSVKVSDGDTDVSNDVIRNIEYKLSNGLSSGKWLYLPSFSFFDGASTIISPDNLAPEETLLYDRTTVILPANGKTVYTYLIPGRYAELTNSDWAATKTRIVKQANPTCPASGNLKVDYYTYPFAPNMNYSFEQGLLSTEQHYHENGSLILEKAYTYQRISPGTVTIKALGFEKVNGLTGFVHGAYTLMANVDKTILTETITGKDLNFSTVSNITSTAYSFNANQMLYEITKTNSDGKVFKTRFKYAKDFNVTTPSGMQAGILKRMNKTGRHGTMIEQLSLVYATVTGASLTLFDSLGVTGKFFPVQSYTYTGSGAFTEATLSAGSPQQFVRDNRYTKEMTVDAFNSIGIPVTVTGRSRLPSTTLYGFDKKMPMMQIAGAQANQFVFTDFENVEAYQLAFSNNTDAWAGNRSYQLLNTGNLTRNTLVKTSDRYYRFTCRAKATTASNIILSVKVSNGAGGWITTSVTYPSSASGTWKLLEGRIDMNSAPSTYNFQLTTGQTILLDDIVFVPESSDYSFSSYKPLQGKVSETNSRGQALFYEYDQLGRLIYMRNSDKEILEAHEYKYKLLTYAKPKSSFSCNNANPYAGQSVVFTAPVNCLTPLSYVWKVNGVTQASTASTLNYTFPTHGEFDVQLTVTHAQYGSTSTTSHYDVAPMPLYVSMEVDILTPIDGCWQDWERTFTATISGGCYNAGDVSYEWYFENSLNYGLVGTTTTPSFTFNFLTQGVGRDYVMKCVVRSTCGSGQNTQVSSGTSNLLGISYNPCN